MMVGVQNRFRTAMESYCRGALEQVDTHSQSSFPTLEEQLEVRRRAAGVEPAFPLIE